MPKTPIPLPQVRTVGLMQPMTWLVLAWRDMARSGWISFAHGLAITAFGGAILAVAHHRFWLLAGALSGFLVVAPVLATSLYALSRALEQRQEANLGVVLKTWLNWQNSHFNKWGNDYWCMVQFGALLALAATGWVITSAAFITLLAPVPVETPMDFMRHVVLANNGWLFELWLALGSLLAAPIFASSVIAMPLLLDRRASLRVAVLTSWQVVVANPLPMAFWAALILGFTLLGLGSLLLGLIFVMPMLGHASWHAYRDLVDASSLPLRDAAVATGQRSGVSS
ncbi:DUF2189 domain-containing protein [Acidovorax temperans]|jgi:uncharacterized membrane protein|uniref:DUF2189 domain-containing protein n=1 Tax=Acidovorax temperans TaxID=80878 RepID=UPI001A9538E1|nr:DUF2189 domain-containing protein [Acidovorax temperans]MBO0942891.1 DUF2189 domain-containing protein [Acidovorax temperans]WCT25924.1 DUF2189 domain-containing protein [Acidovorax temperans]HRM64871.1 DUF2189 domain-containing protein [Acidovorax temperans]